MAENWQSFVANLAVVALFISAWVHGQFIFAGRPRYWRNAAFGVAMGIGAVASMLLAIQLDGVLFDLRYSLVAIAGFFGGPVAAVIAAGIAVIYRYSVIGGPAAATATIGITVLALTGVLLAMPARGRTKPVARAILLAGAVGAVTTALTFAFRATISLALAPLSLPLVVMNTLATLVAALFILRHEVLERERNLFAAAFAQSPDYQYVKNRNSRFAAVNAATAKLSGFASPAEMVGKSDFDVTAPDRATALIIAEQKIIETGVPILDQEEMVSDEAGNQTWYRTSKVPLRDGDGEIIGLTGVTRDITQSKRLGQELVESRNQLSHVLTEMSEGIAMFDSQGTLVYCNDQYRNLFGLTAEIRRPGQHIRDILHAVAETGEQNGIPDDAGAIEAWIDTVAGTLQAGGEQEISLADGRWLRLRTRPTSDGTALVVVSDVTTIKAAEVALQTMTDKLTLLATTDGLTGLANRRAFDQSLELELARGRRGGLPLSLMIIDVDRFKAYNDIYGHPAGDRALKVVAEALSEVLKRPADIAARYGGEEFVAILPDTDEEGAMFIADAFRDALRERSVPHSGGDTGVLTASVGVATFVASEVGVGAAELLRRADEALYDAKRDGRDRSVAWTPGDVRPRIGARA